jgi:prevent-host-death family protein
MILAMKISVGEARNSLTKLLKHVEEGEEITITRHGRAVAKLSRAEKPKDKPKLGTLKGIPKPGWDTDIALSEWEVLGLPADHSGPAKGKRA